MALFTSDELAAYPGTEGIPTATADLLTALAESLIYGLIPRETADGSMVAAGIALEVVSRAWRNREGYASERVDDYAYSRPGETRNAGVYLTADERSRLQALTADTARRRVRSVRLASWSVPQS